MSRKGRHDTADGVIKRTSTRAIFVRSVFPAPYRTAVFEQLSRTHQLFVAFEKSSDPERNDDWFETAFAFNAVTLSSKLGRKCYRLESKRLRSYSCVLMYDYASLGSVFLMVRCLWMGIPYLINCDGAILGPSRWRDHVKRFFIKRAAICLAGSESASRYFQTYGAAPSRIDRHPFTSLAAADVFDEPAGADEREGLRADFGLPLSSVIVGSVGGFIPRKGFDTLLEAWLHVSPEAHLVLIGEGPCLDSYRSFIATHHLVNVTILPFQDSASLRLYYRAMDGFVLATREDIWGLVINEAMACGLPVITTDRCVAGVELIGDGEGGAIVPSGRPDLLESAILSLLRMSVEARAEIGRRNLTIISDFTYEAIAAAHNASIESMDHMETRG